MSLSEDMPIEVTEHAMWRAAERFPCFDTVRIEDEVRRALREGRYSAERGHLGLAGGADPKSFYVWTGIDDRVYAIRSDPDRFVVTTTMKGDKLRGRRR